MLHFFKQILSFVLECNRLTKYPENRGIVDSQFLDEKNELSKTLFPEFTFYLEGELNWSYI